MGIFGDWAGNNNCGQQQNFDQVYNNQPHEGKFSHEALSGAASFFAMREYEKHEASNGQPPNHQFAKEMIAGIVGGEVDKLCETKGLDYIDREKAKRQAREQATQMYDNSYGQQY
ncbi:hypothetical protein CVIRNUC_007586 [Coccomyxa viridis]|uniref:Uncharacterized protein n=1 Tax=Coccomyxa viridis TaxID=1274662 RepID=A0AAV1IBB1_9CHLO|nr:hypothetical protein CVIRNUC_007586 [Coccomyxa viridis]